MKILVISESINVEDSSGSKVNVAMINSLKNCGYELLVLHYSHIEIQLPNINCKLIKENKFSIWYVLSRFQRLLYKTLKININPFVESFLGFSFYNISDTLSIVSRLKNEKEFFPDFVITLSKGASFRPHRALLKLPELHNKWIAYIHDPYPFHFYPRPYNWVEIGFNKKERFMREMSNKSKYMVFPSLLLKEWMQSYFQNIEFNGLVLPHQITDTTIPLDQTIDFLDTGKFNIIHAGNLLKQRNPKYLLDAFLDFLEFIPEAKSNSQLILVGDNSFHSDLLTQYQNHPNIIIKGYLAFEIVQILEKKSSVNVILEAKSEISPFLPGKFPNLVLADKPILLLGPYYSEVKRLLGKDYKYWCESDSLDEIKNNIILLYEQWKTNKNNLKLDKTELLNYLNKNYLSRFFEELYNKQI